MSERHTMMSPASFSLKQKHDPYHVIWEDVNEKEDGLIPSSDVSDYEQMDFPTQHLTFLEFVMLKMLEENAPS